MGRQAYLRGFVRNLQEMSQANTNEKILEVGCGNGTGTQPIKEFFKPKELIATELDEQLFKIAKIKNIGSRITVEVGNTISLRFLENEFDIVIGLSMIHHIPNWRDCIDELHRVIKPNSLLINKELSIETFQTPPDMVPRRIVSHPYESMLRKEEFFKHLEQRGFKIVAHRPHSMMYLLKDFFLVARKEWQGQI